MTAAVAEVVHWWLHVVPVVVLITVLASFAILRQLRVNAQRLEAQHHMLMSLHQRLATLCESVDDTSRTLASQLEAESQKEDAVHQQIMGIIEMMSTKMQATAEQIRIIDTLMRRAYPHSAVTEEDCSR